MLLCHTWQCKSYCLTSQLILGSEQSIFKGQMLLHSSNSCPSRLAERDIANSDFTSRDGGLMTGVGPSSWLIVSLVKMWRRTMRWDRGGRNVTWGCWWSSHQSDPLRSLSGTCTVVPCIVLHCHHHQYYVSRYLYMWVELSSFMPLHFNLAFINIEWPHVPLKQSTVSTHHTNSGTAARTQHGWSRWGGDWEREREPANTNVTHLIQS